MHSSLILLAVLVATPPEPATSPLQIGVAHFPPMIIVNPKTSEISGSDFDMFEEIARERNWRRGIEYEYEIVPSFHQLISQLKNGKLSVGISGISITHDRLQEMEFSQPYKNSGQRILIPAEDPTTSISAYVGKFFRIDIGISLIALLANFAIWGFAFYVAEKRGKKNQPNIKTIEDGFLTAFDVGTTVGFGRFYPTTRIGHVLAIVCFFTSIILTGDVISTLTTNKITHELANAINGPEDLKGKIVATIGGTTSVATVEAYNAVKVIECKDFYEAVVEMRLGNAAAVVADDPIILNYAKDHPDHAMVAGSRFHPEDYGIAFAVGNDDKVKEFSIAIARLRESGRLQAIEENWFGQN